MDFISRATARVPWLGAGIRKQQEIFLKKTGRPLCFSDAWWTPPLSPRRAWDLERTQIETLGLKALVSLSDHDNIDAGLHLHVLEGMRDCPISVEWTVPYRKTFFHLGIHNVPYPHAAVIMQELARFTSEPDESRIAVLLDWVAAAPETLVVMNHPCWDEKGIGHAEHEGLVDRFLRFHRRWIHALELNGLRPWKENQRVRALADRLVMPFISGGDRHGIEPNACVNLTNAANFSEFAEEIRTGACSNVVFMPQYREPFRLRILENLFQILQDDPQHSDGWIHWSHRVFYKGHDGQVKSIAEIWGGHPPAVVDQFVKLMTLFGNARIRSALRFALTEAEEFAL